ncbi:MAG: hypothetical protein AVDCRST_MAG80-1607, partial [uncultured Rubrobacteraceae bacterium]
VLLGGRLLRRADATEERLARPSTPRLPGSPRGVEPAHVHRARL